MLTVVAIVINWAAGWDAFPSGSAIIPSSLLAMPDFSLVGAFDFGAFAALGVLSACIWVFTMILSDFFDSFGTLLGVGGAFSSSSSAIRVRGHLPGVLLRAAAGQDRTVVQQRRHARPRKRTSDAGH